MANINLVEDANGELIKLEYYCSDLHAKQSPNYNGWYGCYELHTPEVCQTCQTPLGYIGDN